MKTIKTVFITVVLTLLAVAALYFTVLRVPEPEKTTSTTIDVQGKINDIGELATAEYGYKLAQVTDKPAKTIAGFEIPFTASKVIYSYEGLIKAGVSFQDIVVTVDEGNKIVDVRLPQAAILSSEVFFDSLTVYDESYSPFNTFTFEDMNLGISDLQASAEASALEGGLLDRAAENARNILTTSLAGYFDLTEYTVRFR